MRDRRLLIGGRGRGRAEGVEGAQGSVGHHQRVIVGAPAALPSDAQHHLRREELDHHLSAADTDTATLHQAGRRAVVGRRVAAVAGLGCRRWTRMPPERCDEEQRRRRLDSDLGPVKAV